MNYVNAQELECKYTPCYVYKNSIYCGACLPQSVRGNNEVKFYSSEGVCCGK
jgi:hypothetical protein